MREISVYVNINVQCIQVAEVFNCPITLLVGSRNKADLEEKTSLVANRPLEIIMIATYTIIIRNDNFCATRRP